MSSGGEHPEDHKRRQQRQREGAADVPRRRQRDVSLDDDEYEPRDRTRIRRRDGRADREPAVPEENLQRGRNESRGEDGAQRQPEVVQVGPQLTTPVRPAHERMTWTVRGRFCAVAGAEQVVIDVVRVASVPGTRDDDKCEQRQRDVTKSRKAPARRQCDERCEREAWNVCDGHRPRQQRQSYENPETDRPADP